MPQSSVLGPLLFLIYVNDINSAVPEAEVKLFADDTNMFVRDRDLLGVVNKTNTHLRSLSEWFLANKLSFSYDKTCFTVFVTKKVRDSDVSIKINSYEISKVKHCKYLGIIIDDELNRTKHIDNIYNKIVRFSGIIYKNA